MADHIPAEVFSPGEFLRDELEARGWTQGHLAEVMGRPAQAISEIVAGKKRITPATAKGLAAALGTTPELWLNLDAAFRLSQTTEDDAELQRRAKLYSLAPVKDMIRRGWIKDTKSVQGLEQEMKRFFGVSSLDEPSSICFAAKKSTDYGGEHTPAQKAWACRARQLSRAVSAAKFDKKSFEQNFAMMRGLLVSEHDVRRVPRALADMGIRLVFVEHLPKTRIDGAAFWLDKDSPAVALSLRFDRIDSFWFALTHECMHIRHEHGWSLDMDLVGTDRQPTEEKPPQEQEADREAGDFLVPDREVERFFLRHGTLITPRKVIEFANRLQVHPGIVMGRLHHKTKKYYVGRDLLVKVRDILTQNALSDGWGYAPPLN